MIPIGETQDGRADMTNFEMDLFDTRMSYFQTKGDNDEQCCPSSRNRIIKPACLPITVIALFIIALVFLSLFNEDDLSSPEKLTDKCTGKCGLTPVESIPTDMMLNPHFQPTHEYWLELIGNATKYIQIAALYWNLNENTTYPTASAGKNIFHALIQAAQRGVKIRIVQDGSSGISKNSDTQYLVDHNLAEVRSINFTRLMGSGVLHTKFIIADLKSVYIGSANMDWKSLTEVKELGLAFRNCSCVAADLYKIFAVYWRLGEPDAKIPSSWPISFRTLYNSKKPLELDTQVATSLFISSSPLPFNPKGREFDLTAILELIYSAKKSVSVSVMDMIPQTLYMKKNVYWPAIDNALRDAAFRGVKVRLLISKWAHSRKFMFTFLKSLQDINPALPKTVNGTGSISVKIFEVPASEAQKEIPFARVNHNKYLITDEAVYIGTSNWSGDYFISTAGVGVIMRSGKIGIWQDIAKIFERDWASAYAKDL